MNKTTKVTTALLGVGVGAILLKKWFGNKPLKADVVNENAPVSSDEPCSVCANVEKVHRKTRKRITKQWYVNGLSWLSKVLLEKI